MDESTRYSKILVSLFLVVTFEGLMRRLVPSIQMPVFFIKDFLCVLGVYLLYTGTVRISRSLTTMLKLYTIAFVVPFGFTCIRDPILAVFGAKQYLLYTTIFFLIVASFKGIERRKLNKLLRYVCYTFVLTTLVAIVQSRLPSTHWLNKSPSGESLEHFSAAGKLRLSSTFSFTAQYAYYLAFGSSVVYYSSMQCKNFRQAVVSASLVGCIIIGAFLTGGRYAVLGSTAIVSCAALLSMIRSGAKSVVHIAGLFIAACLLYMCLKTLSPDFFEAYEARSQGYGGRTHFDEMYERLALALQYKSNGIGTQGTFDDLFGRGVGVMSNGSDRLSGYARAIRSQKIWTETELATLVWEGGYYLASVTYLFRGYYLLIVARRWWKIRDKRVQGATSAFLAFAVIEYVWGQLSIQPPLTIWWWSSLGLIYAASFPNSNLTDSDRKSNSFPNEITERLSTSAAASQSSAVP